MTPRSLIVALAAMLLASAAGAQDKAYTLQRSFKVGDVGIYAFDMVAKYNGAEIPGSGAVERAVKETKPNGDVVYTYTDKGTKYVLNGEETTLPPEPPMTVTVDKRGKVLSIARKSGAMGMMPESVMKLLAILSQCILPDKPVKPGDTWTTEFDNPTLKNSKFAVKATLVGPDKIGADQFVKIRETVSDLLLDIADPSAGGLSTQTTFWIVPDTGRIARLETTAKNLPVPGLGSADITMKATIKPPAPKAEAK